MSRRPKLPTLPAPPADASPQQRSFFQAIKQQLDALVGQLGERDRAVTFRDLEDGGLARPHADGYTILPGQEGPEGPAGPPGDPGADGLGLPTVGAGVVPPAVANLKAVAAYSSIILTWDDPDWPAGASTFNVAYFEIFRATSATPNPPVPNASYSFGQTRALVFSDLVGTSKTYYYWVRIVGKNNEIGPVVGPVSATTSPNVPQLLDLLTGQITESQLYSALTDRIDLIDAPATGLASQYTFKVDVAGHIAGYGFATTAADAAPYSAFGLRADQFWVAPPAVASATAPTTNRYKGMVWVDTSVVPSVVRYWNGVSSWVTTPQALPFVVQTTPTTVNGVAVAPGVYIDDLFVKNGSITNAKIGNAAIDDAKIANLSAEKITAGTIAADRLDAAVVTAKVANLNAAVITQGFLNTAVIQDGTITDAKIANEIKSTNYVAGTAGWRITKAGTIEAQDLNSRGSVTVGRPGNPDEWAVVRSDGKDWWYNNNAGFIMAHNKNYAGSGLSYSLLEFRGGPQALLRWRGGTHPDAASGVLEVSGVLTADAVNAVNTVNIAGQAVTFPNHSRATWTRYDGNYTVANYGAPGGTDGW